MYSPLSAVLNTLRLSSSKASAREVPPPTDICNNRYPLVRYDNNNVTQSSCEMVHRQRSNKSQSPSVIFWACGSVVIFLEQRFFRLIHELYLDKLVGCKIIMQFWKCRLWKVLILHKVIPGGQELTSGYQVFVVLVWSRQEGLAIWLAAATGGLGGTALTSAHQDAPRTSCLSTVYQENNTFIMSEYWTLSNLYSSCVPRVESK